MGKKINQGKEELNLDKQKQAQKKSCLCSNHVIMRLRKKSRKNYIFYQVKYLLELLIHLNLHVLEYKQQNQKLILLKF